MQTAEILKRSSKRPLHTLKARYLHDVWISSSSQWGDLKWKFDVAVHGQRDHLNILDWQIKLADGSLLTDGGHPELLDWVRRLVWSLFACPGDGFPPLTPGTASSIVIGLRCVVPWLVENKIRWPHELKQIVLDHFFSDLPWIIAKSDRGDEREDGTNQDGVLEALW